MTKLPGRAALAVSALTLIALGSAPAHAGLLGKLTDSGPKRVELSEASDKAAVYKEAFTPAGMFGKAPEAPSNGLRKVVVAGFQVEFATEQKAIARGAGAGAGLASTTDVIYTLKGASDAQMQAVADRLHAAFLAKLRDKGFEVLPVSALAQTGYQESLTKANQAPAHHERGTAIDLLITPTEKEVDNASVIATAKDTAPDVFARYTAGLGPGPGAADALQVNVIHLRLKLNFARFEESGWFNPEIDNQPQNMLSPGGTFMQVFMPGGLHIDYPLANSVVLPHRLADKAVPVEATTGQTAQRAAGGAARALGGFLKGGLSGASDIVGGAVGAAHSTLASGNYEVAAGADYEELLAQDGMLALSMIIEALAKP
ncbi:MAG: hypothetical protein JNM98_07670 [Rhodocyclaceae bacterium]|nr:hypothetical protein [Rhodocyclaceae bacterium]